MPLKGGALLEAYVEAEKRQEGEYKSYREVLAGAARDLVTRFGIEPDPKALAGFAASVPEWPAFQDTSEALRRLGEKGYKRYILSNVDVDLLRATIRLNGLYVDGFVTADECQSYKPALGHWLRFMAETGALKEEMLHVAQSVYHDIRPVGTLGIASAWVNRYQQALPADVSPLYITDSLQGLVEILG